MSTILDQPRLTPRSALRYRPTVQRPQPPASRVPSEANTTGGLPSAKPIHQKRRLHWAITVGSAMIVTMLLLFFVQLASASLTVLADDLHYGRPRTFQTDVFVGHESGKTPSHFVAMNLHGRAYIIEIPGGDASKTRMIVGPQLSGSEADLIPVTLHFVLGEGDGKDMVVRFGAFEIRYLNEQGTFRQRQTVA